MGGRGNRPRLLSHAARGGVLRGAAFAAALLVACGSALAVDEGPAPDARVVISYDLPGDPALAPIREALMGARALERFRETLSGFRLRRPLTARTASCAGEANAVYDADAITVCYEYVARVVALARHPSRPAWIGEEDAIAGPILDVFLHEAAHALFDQFEVPILGRGEDAADAVASLFVLHLSEEAAKARVAAIAFMYLETAGLEAATLAEARLRDFRADDFANGHGTPLQRHYNLICLAYGFDPGRFADAVALSAMPASRAAGCALEYREALRAFRRLLGPHLDPQAAEAAFGRGDALLRAP